MRLNPQALHGAITLVIITALTVIFLVNSVASAALLPDVNANFLSTITVLLYLS